MKALDIANYFLLKADDDAGDIISNLKLQKLLYYAQGFHLAILGTPAFNEEIVSWTHGPVVPVVYREFNKNGANGIPSPSTCPKLPAATKKVVDEVYEVMGQFSAWKLRNMTHEEPPWKDVEINDPISHKSLKRYFSTQLVK